VKQRFLRFLKFMAYPALYMTCLMLFFYLTFPWNRLKDRVIAEIAIKAQKPKSAIQRVEIDDLDSYWFTGVEATGVRIYLPPSDDAGADKDKPVESIIKVDELNARLQILPLFLGRLRVKFWAHAFNGDIKGTVPVGGSSGPVEIQLDAVDLSYVDVIKDAIGIPVKGIVTGKLELAAEGGKFSKASGMLDLAINGVSVGDGKSKIKNQIALPEAKLGDLLITAEAKEGALKITKFEGNGADIELAGDGKINVREPANNSVADLYVRFKFTDAYRNKSDLTKTLLGAPGSTAPSLFELADPRIKRSKRSDGFFGWHVHGALGKLKFDPSATDSPAGGKTKGRGESPFTTKKPLLPLGNSTARDGKEDDNTAKPTSAEPKPADVKPVEPKAPDPKPAEEVAPSRAPEPPPSEPPAAPPPAMEEGPAPRIRPTPEAQ
jgi:type II secretion system protein N